MRLGAIVLGAAALALVAGVFVLALTGRLGPTAPQAPVVVTTTVPAAPVTATPRATAKLAPAGKKRGSGDDQAGDRNSGDSFGDDQAGDRNAGDSSGDDQAGDGKAGGS